MKKRINFTIGIAISVLFIYLAFRRVEPAEIVYSLKHANYIWIFPNMAIVILTMLIRAERWKYLLRPVRSFKASRLFPSVMIGFMANNILPVRLGEFVRAYSLGVKTGESRSSIFATVVIERIFDSLTLLTMFWLVILFIPFPKTIKDFGVATLIVNAAIIIFLVYLKRKGAGFIAGILRLLSFLPRRATDMLDHMLTNFAEGLNIFEKYRTLGVVASWSVILWILTALSNYFIFMAFGIYPNVVASFILLLFVAAGVMLPSAPGFVGVYQAAAIGAFGVMNHIGIIGYQVSLARAKMMALMVPAYSSMPTFGLGAYCESLGLFGISKGEALSFSIVLWLCGYLPVTLLGLYYLRREHLSLRKINL